MDTIPDHLQKSFGLTEDGVLKHDMRGMIVVKMGETIPDKLDSAIIMYNVSGWHQQKADELAQQLEQIDSRIAICDFPVIQDAAPVNAVGDTFIIPTLPPTSATAPPIYWPNPLVPFETTTDGRYQHEFTGIHFGRETTSGVVPATIKWHPMHGGAVDMYGAAWHEPGDGTVEVTSAGWDWDVDWVAKEIARVFNISAQELGISPE
jgi:hypothetical protein